VADQKISELTELTAAQLATGDSLPVLDVSAVQTKRLLVGSLDARYQASDSDLAAIAAANNGAVLAATTASFLTSDESKLDGIESGADVTDAANVAAAGAIMETDVAAKGDIFVATADNTVAVLSAGSDNQVLTADSATATGVKWSTPTGAPTVVLTATEYADLTPVSGTVYYLIG
jgi:hypothetical protein